MMAVAEKRYYRPDELAREMDEPVSNIKLWMRQGRIHYVHHGKKHKIERVEFLRVLREGVDSTSPNLTDLHRTSPI